MATMTQMTQPKTVLTTNAIPAQSVAVYQNVTLEISGMHKPFIQNPKYLFTLSRPYTYITSQ
jgi:hypothetical protein